MARKSPDISWRDCAHCGERVSLPNGERPGKYYYAVPEAKHLRLRWVTGALVHHTCKVEYFKGEPDSD